MFLALPHSTEYAHFEVKIADSDLAEFGDAEAGGVEELEHGAIPLGAFLEGLRIAWRGGEVRPTARAKPPAKRERRRPDPILAVTVELKTWWDAEPWRTSRELLDRIQAKYPGMYPDGLIRTVQRRLPTPILIADCAVQGPTAPAQIVNAMAMVVRAGVDVVIVGRGGGAATIRWSS